MPTLSRAGLAILFSFALAPLSAQNPIALLNAGVTPGQVVLNPATGAVFIVNTEASTVTVLDGTTNTTSTLNVGIGPQAVAVNPATNKIYVANTVSNTVTVIDGATFSTTSVNTGIAPVALAVNPVTNMIYVANEGSGNVTVINGADNSTSTVTADSAPVAVAVNPVTNKIYVVNSMSFDVTVINGANNSTATVGVGNSPGAIVINPVTNKIYVANAGASTVSIIDGVTNNVDTAIVHSNPVRLAVNTVTNRIYVACFGANILDMINGATEAVTSLTVGTAPNWVSVDPLHDKVYVTNSSDATMTVANGDFSGTPVVPELTTTPLGLAFNPILNHAYVVTDYDFSQDQYDLLVIDGANFQPGSPGGNVPLGSPSAVAVNPVTNKYYVADPGVTGGDNVLIYDGNTDVATFVLVGTTPVSVAVNSLTNKIYVANAGGTVTVIDGATNGTNSVTAGSRPAFVAVNPVTNKIYVANRAGGNVTVIDGTTNSTSTVTVGTGPSAIAVNQATNKIYVANSGSNNVSVIDGATNTVTNVAVGTNPQAIAVNPVTNTVYAGNFGSMDLTVIAGSNNSTTTIALGHAPEAVAVNPLTNKIYLVCGDGSLLVMDGVLQNPIVYATMPSFMPGPASIAVNLASNKIYIALESSNYVNEIEGFSLSPNLTFLGAPADGVAVNPATGKGYFSLPGSSVYIVNEAKMVHVPLTTTITPLPGNVTTSATPTFTFTGASTFSPSAPAGQHVYFQVDTWQGKWQPTSLVSANTYTGTVPTALQTGEHILYAFLGDAQTAESNQAGSDMAGNIAAYYFVVLPGPLSQTITFNPLANQTYGVPPFPISATASSGLPVTFLSNTTAVCTVTGNTVTILAAGTCSITAYQAGNNTYASATPVTQSFTVFGALQISNTSLPAGLAGQAYDVTITATGGTQPYTFSASGLPSFLSINPPNGLVSGLVPVGSAGSYSIRFTV